MKNEKVKAIVARKRPIKIANTTSISMTKTASEETPKKLFTSNKVKNNESQEKIPKTDKNVNIDSLLNLAKVQKPEEEASLSLNIDTNIDINRISSGNLPFIGKKKKLSRVERKERVMQKRIEIAQSKNVKNPSNANSSANRPPQANKIVKKSESLFKNNPDIPIVGQRFVKPLNEIVFTGLPMNSIGLHAHLAKTIADLLDITELTSVQQRTVPVALEGRDVLVRSQTGSGKTLAYALPVVQQLQEIRPKISRTDGILAVIIVPTRELAIQTLEVFIKLLKPFTWIVPTYITGGEKRKAEKARLRKGINILIGTPGRICDHLLHTESFKLDKVKYLVLDEADRLYEFGYEKDVKIIIDALNKPAQLKNPFAKTTEVVEVTTEKNLNLQTMLLSATLSSSVHQLAGLALKNPLFIDTCDLKNIELPPKTESIAEQTEFDLSIEQSMANDNNIVIPETVTQKYILVPPKLRLVTLAGLIANETNALNKTSKILVFFATENLVDYHYDLMTETLTKKVFDSDDEEDEEEDNSNSMALLNDSESELEDEDGLLDEIKSKSKKKQVIPSKLLLGDVKFFK